MIQVACGIILSAGRILAVERGSGMRHPGKWEFPGGKIEGGETPEECLVRELQEELAISVRILEAFPDFAHAEVEDEGDLKRGGRIIQFFPFVVEITEGTPVLKEHAQLRWCLPEELGMLDWLAADVAIVQAYRQWSGRCGQ